MCAIAGCMVCLSKLFNGSDDAQTECTCGRNELCMRLYGIANRNLAHIDESLYVYNIRVVLNEGPFTISRLYAKY